MSNFEKNMYIVQKVFEDEYEGYNGAIRMIAYLEDEGDITHEEAEKMVKIVDGWVN